MENSTQNKKLSVHRLSKLLCISESSVRRNLSALEELGKMKRTFGDAVLFEAAEREVSLMYRRSQNMRQKATSAILFRKRSLPPKYRLYP